MDKYYLLINGKEHDSGIVDIDEISQTFTDGKRTIIEWFLNTGTIMDDLIWTEHYLRAEEISDLYNAHEVNFINRSSKTYFENLI